MPTLKEKNPPEGGKKGRAMDIAIIAIAEAAGFYFWNKGLIDVPLWELAIIIGAGAWSTYQLHKSRKGECE